MKKSVVNCSSQRLSMCNVSRDRPLAVKQQSCRQQNDHESVLVEAISNFSASEKSKDAGDENKSREKNISESKMRKRKIIVYIIPIVGCPKHYF